MTENVEIQTRPDGGCACGHRDTSTPVLDVRAIPPQVRHGAIHGAFEALPPGTSLLVVAPHAPVPLIKELEARFPITVEYLQEGPEELHVRFTRG